MTKTERNAEICQMYVAGATLQAIGEHFQISRERVRQLLRKAGVFRKDRAVEKSDRDEFLGVNVSESTKDALKQEADRQGVSMSKLASDTLDDMLAQVKE